MGSGVTLVTLSSGGGSRGERGGTEAAREGHSLEAKNGAHRFKWLGIKSQQENAIV